VPCAINENAEKQAVPFNLLLLSSPSLELLIIFSKYFQFVLVILICTICNVHVFYKIIFIDTLEQNTLDTNAGKTIVLSCHRCLINTGVEKMNYI
jgi:hypothetical protein